MNKDTAIIFIDAYNEFLHPEGKLYPVLSDSIQKADAIGHMSAVLKHARAKDIPMFYCMHQQTSEHSMAGWTMMNKSLQGLKSKMVFEAGSWGVQFFDGMAPVPENGDVVVSKHWNSSSFYNTDLDYQLRQRGIKNVIMTGLVANTCLESTARYAYEHGYALTMLTDLVMLTPP